MHVERSAEGKHRTMSFGEGTTERACSATWLHQRSPVIGQYDYMGMGALSGCNLKVPWWSLRSERPQYNHPRNPLPPTALLARQTHADWPDSKVGDVMRIISTNGRSRYDLILRFHPAGYASFGQCPHQTAVNCSVSRASLNMI